MGKRHWIATDITILISVIGALVGLVYGGYHFLGFTTEIGTKEREEIRRKAAEKVQQHLAEIERNPKQQGEAEGLQSTPSTEQVIPVPGTESSKSELSYKRCVVMLVKVDKYSFDQASRVCSDRRPADEALRDVGTPAGGRF
jgi:hypothetical protein